MGINIPNYDDIRQEEGFKNVYLSNVYPAPSKTTIQFFSEADSELICEHGKDALLLQVALHELVGHGTGKLFTKKDNGEINFNKDAVNPFNGEAITTFYLEKETWSQKFGKLHSGYEECRADTVALYLANFDGPFEIFFAEQSREQWNNIYYVSYLSSIRGALIGLEYFNVEKKLWTQAHIWGRWVIFTALREGDPELIKFEFFKDEEGNDDFKIHVDREKLRTTGYKAISEFLHKLHVYKSIGDFDTASKFFEHYSKVSEDDMKIRGIILAKKKPRRMELQPNVFADGTYKDYDITNEGIIESYQARWEGGAF